jgi:uncharacterized protein YndB with AHSA1/START domain
MNTAQGLKVSTPSDLEIVMTRTFDAPRRLVWDAITKPELLRRWMFTPQGWEWAECRMDVRVGGKFLWSWNGPDGQVALTISGENREVVPPSRIVHTEHMVMGPGAAGPGCGECPPWELVATTDLTERDGKTSLKMTLHFPNKDARDTALASGMEHGVSAGYDRLDEILAGM